MGWKRRAGKGKKVEGSGGEERGMEGKEKPNSFLKKGVGEGGEGS